MKNKEGQEWLRAVATLKDGCSYGLAGQRFLKGRPTQVRNLRVRNALVGNKAFHLVDFWEPLPTPDPEPEEVSGLEPEEVEKTEPKKEASTKSKSPKVSKVKVKRVDRDKEGK